MKVCKCYSCVSIHLKMWEEKSKNEDYTVNKCARAFANHNKCLYGTLKKKTKSTKKKRKGGKLQLFFFLFACILALPSIYRAWY